MPSADEGAWISVAEAARRLQVSGQTIRNMISRKQLAARREPHGSRAFLYVDAADVRTHLPPTDGQASRRDLQDLISMHVQAAEHEARARAALTTAYQEMEAAYSLLRRQLDVAHVPSNLPSE